MYLQVGTLVISLDNVGNLKHTRSNFGKNRTGLSPTIPCLLVVWTPVELAIIPVVTRQPQKWSLKRKLEGRHECSFVAVPLPIHTVCRHDLRQTKTPAVIDPFRALFPSFQPQPRDPQSLLNKGHARRRAKPNIVRLIPARDFSQKTTLPRFYRRPRASPK